MLLECFLTRVISREKHPLFKKGVGLNFNGGPIFGDRGIYMLPVEAFTTGIKIYDLP